MMELPEAVTLARQLNEVAKGKMITSAQAGHSPHKFAFFSEEPSAYPGLLNGRIIEKAAALGPFVRLSLDDGRMLLLGDGVRLAWYASDAKRPSKHQLLLELSDGAALCASVQMYGGMWVSDESSEDNPYYLAACEKPSPLSDGFSQAYFDAIVSAARPTLSAKALLATEQRIPGLGNGVLQDILFGAGVHPKRKVSTFEAGTGHRLYSSMKTHLLDMAGLGGRDTEKDLFGQAGGYKTKLNAKSAGAPCPVCGTPIIKQAYLGGSVYFCSICQPL